MTLTEAKANLPALLDVLGLAGQRPSNHHRCRFCEDNTALSVYQGDAGWRFRCHRCGAAGSLVDAVVRVEGLTLAEVVERIAGESGSPRPPAPPMPRRPKYPVLDRARADRLFEVAFRNILEGRAHEWLGKRAITREWVALCPNLGFILNAPIAGWRHPLVNTWLIRVCTADGECVALKGHRENPTKGVKKGCWLPFGTEPTEKPRHGHATLWPPPEWFDAAGIIYITEGELKAAAILSAGRNATSPTTGADFRWTPDLVQRFSGRRVCVVFDDDPAGLMFKQRTLIALHGSALELKAITFGRKD